MYRFHLRPSRCEALMVYGGHGVALLAIGTAGLQFAAAALSICLLLANLYWCRRHKPCSGCLQLSADGARFQHRSGITRWRLPRVLYRSSYLLCLRFEGADPARDLAPWRLTLYPDSLSRDEWRRLHRVLRFELSCHHPLR